ncbi:MAG: mannose-1-phosphate guanylyltransferase [Sumerlaeia bacterium]
MNVAVIMAGGSGERFWPLSRRTFPKQLLRITAEDESMLQEAVSRVLPLFTDERVYIATTEPLRQAICKGESRIAPQRIFAEPDKRNTLGCLVWSACQLRASLDEEDVTMAVLTADHRIGEPLRFLECVKKCLAVAKNEKAIVTIGAAPTRPETAFGYIEVEGLKQAGNIVSGFYPVKRFTEKPDQETADAFVTSGDYLWNCGMFFWTLETFFQELAEHQPAAFAVAQNLIVALRDNNQAKAVELFSALPNLSIDYAILEKSTRVCCVPASFSWDDVGSFDSIHRYRKANADGNILEGNTILHEATNCIALNNTENGKQVLALVGVKDLVVVTTDDGLIVVHRDHVQDVKKIVEQLKATNASQV